MRQTHRPDYPLSTSMRLHAPSAILPAISFASGKPSSAKPEAALKRLPHRTFWNQTIEKRPGALGGVSMVLSTMVAFVFQHSPSGRRAPPVR